MCLPGLRRLTGRRSFCDLTARDESKCIQSLCVVIIQYLRQRLLCGKGLRLYETLRNTQSDHIKKYNQWRNRENPVRAISEDGSEGKDKIIRNPYCFDESENRTSYTGFCFGIFAQDPIGLFIIFAHCIREIHLL